ncbi:MAG: hypothetical protein ACKOW5_01195, partial [Actinomycetales bacterium]
LGEHVAGSWTWDPPGNAVNADGSVDDSVPWELEYHPPPDDASELIESLRLTQDEEGSWARFTEDAARAHRTLQRMAVSAVDDACRSLTSDIVLDADVGDGRVGEPRAGGVHATHDRLVASITEIGVGAEGDSELAGSWWGQMHQQLIEASEAWMRDVPPALPIGNVARQAIKKKVSGWVGYVLQYAGLLRGNAAAFELVRMTKYLGGVYERIRVLLETEGVVAPRSQIICDEVRAAYCRALVSASVEDRWRRRMGEDAGKVGQMIIEIVGPRGQV